MAVIVVTTTVAIAVMAVTDAGKARIGTCLGRPERHPACRRREARPGFRMERENLFSDAKGQATSGSSREGESTEAEGRDGAA
jgi:hypothetical protein